MWTIRRIRLDRVGTSAARFLNVTLDLTSPTTGQPVDSILWLRNGGGKTTIVALIGALLRPARDEFLSGSEGPRDGAKHLEDYILGPDTAHVVVEWGESDGRRLVTGAVYEWADRQPPADPNRDHDRLNAGYYAFAPLPGRLELEGLPYDVGDRRPNLEAFLSHLRPFAATTDVVVTRKQSEWTKALDDRRIDSDLWRTILAMNRTEGGIEQRFLFTTPNEFVRYLLQLIVSPDEPDGVADLLRKVAAKLVRRPDILEELRFAREAVERLTELDVAYRNPFDRTYGVADLLVRSDVLATWFPELLSWEDATVGAPGIGQEAFHYRPVDIKFHSFEITGDGHAGGSADQLAYAAQVWTYNQALGRLQGYTAPSSYLLGRTWQHGDERGEGCLDRLARVDHDRWLPNREMTLGDLAAEGAAWIRRLRTQGAGWQVLPSPSVPELFPHARNSEDAPWHATKREIAEALGELTLLPAMNPERRAAAHASGLMRWTDPGLSAAALGVTTDAFATRLDAVLAANNAMSPTVLPEHIVRADPAWRHGPAAEFYVDFETVTNLDDDFSGLPRVGGQAQIVQIGCGRLDAAGDWQFAQWTVDALTVAEEGQILGEWLAHMASICAALGQPLGAARINHWSAAEPVNLDSAYNAARTRHPDAGWPVDLPWFDILERVVRAEPVTVTGAFNFGLKSIAKAMHAAGLIATTWSDGPTDGLGAMIGTWAAAREARGAEAPLSEHPLMVEIGLYNEVDCRAMAEVLEWLRGNR